MKLTLCVADIRYDWVLKSLTLDFLFNLFHAVLTVDNREINLKLTRG